MKIWPNNKFSLYIPMQHLLYKLLQMKTLSFIWKTKSCNNEKRDVNFWNKKQTLKANLLFTFQIYISISSHNKQTWTVNCPKQRSEVTHNFIDLLGSWNRFHDIFRPNKNNFYFHIYFFTMDTLKFDNIKSSMCKMCLSFLLYTTVPVVFT